MHVLYIASWYPSNNTDVGGSFFREQAKALQEQGVRVGVLAPRLSFSGYIKRWPSNIGNQVANEDGILTVRRTILNSLPLISTWNMRRLARATKSAYLKYCHLAGKPDIVHVQSMLMVGPGAAEICEEHDIPMVIQEHSSAFGRAVLPKSVLKMIENSLEKSTQHFAVSSTHARNIESELGLQINSFSVVPNSVSSKFFEQNLPDRSGSQFSFVHASLLNKNKNVDLLLEAFATAFFHDATVVLRVIGDGPESSNLRARASSLNISDKVQFLGLLSRERVAEELAKSHVFILSSNVETFGVVLIEAMALGLPILATDSGGPSDIVDSGAGLLVPVGDAEALADSMLSIRRHYGVFKPAEIREKCRQKYSQGAIARRWLGIYRNILAQKLE